MSHTQISHEVALAKPPIRASTRLSQRLLPLLLGWVLPLGLFGLW